MDNTDVRAFFQQYYWHFGLVLVLIAAWFSGGYHHADEHYQILEFANMHMGRTTLADMPWEWSKAMRPALQPMMAVGLVRAAEWVGLRDPFVQVFLLRLVSGLLSVWLLWRWHRALQPQLGLYFGLLACFLWTMPYMGVRFSSECWSMLAFGLGALALHQKWRNGYLLAGFLMGLSFQFRYQMGFAIAGAIVWMFWSEKARWQLLGLWALGTVPAFVLGGWCDAALYGKWIFPAYNYFKINLLDGVAATFGVEPVWWYFPEFLMRMFHPIGAAFLVMAYFGWRKIHRNIWVWSMVPFVLAHMAIGHKEMRFLFPAMPAMLVLAAAGWQHLDSRFSDKKYYRIASNVLIALNMLLLPISTIRPAMEGVPYYRFIFDQCQMRPTVLYAVQNHPYHPASALARWYMHPNLTVKILDNFDQLDTLHLGPNDLVLAERLRHPKLDTMHQLQPAYCYFPNWIRHINVGGWQDRSRLWRIYRCVN